MKYRRFFKITLFVIIGIIFLSYISLFIMGLGMQSPEGYNATDEEKIFIENFDKQTKLNFSYTNRHHDSIIQNIDIYDDNDSLSKVTFLNRLNIKKFSDSTFHSFMKVYNQKNDVNTLKIKFHLSTIDTVFLYKIEDD